MRFLKNALVVHDVGYSHFILMFFFYVCHPDVFNTYINIQYVSVKHNKTLLYLS